MNCWVTTGIWIAVGESFIPFIIGFIKRNNTNREILWLILVVILSLNAIWYSALIMEFAHSRLSFNLNLQMIVNIISVTFLFFIRFIFLFSFLKLYQSLLDIKLTKGILITLKLSGMAVAGIWLLGVLEFLILKSTVLTSNFLLYTDILIFFIVIISCIYSLYKVDLLYDRKEQKAVKLLTIIYMIPMVLGFLKWLANGMLQEESIWEQLSIPILIFVMNGMIIIWLVIYGDKFRVFAAHSKRKNVTDELTKKYNISKREMEVIRLISEGYTNQQIADELFISIETVKDHNSRIYLKTDVKNRTQLAKLFLKDS